MVSGIKQHIALVVIGTISLLALTLQIIQYNKPRVGTSEDYTEVITTPLAKTPTTVVPLIQIKEEWKNKVDLFLDSDSEIETQTLSEDAKKYFEVDLSVNYEEDIAEDIPEIHYKKSDINIKKGYFPVYYPTPSEKRKLVNDVKKTYFDRKELLRKECGSPKRFFYTEDMQLIAAPNENIVVCVVQKAGSTSWHRLIYSLRNSSSDWVKAGHTINYDSYQALPKETKDFLLHSSNVTRVIITRHPFSRLISGWENKFLNKNMQMNHGSMLKTMPKIKEFAKDYPDPYHYISFEGLVKFILKEGMEKIDVHFKSVDQLCRPCDYAYDFVVKSETSPVKSWFVLDRFKAKFPPFTSHAPTITDEQFPKPLATVRTDPNEFLHDIEKYESSKIKALFSKLDKTDVHKLLAFYQRDFEYFGYTFNEGTLESTVL